MDLNVAGRHRAFAIREQPDPPIVLCDPERFARAGPAKPRAAAVPLGHARAQGAPGVFPDDLLDRQQPRVIIRVEVDAEDTRQKDAVTQLQPPQLHVTGDFVDDDLTADS